jgi:GNAT superfamily N-acetyltransferase
LPFLAQATRIVGKELFMPIPSDAFERGDVYIDYAFENALFRYENATGKVYRRFYNEREDEVPPSSELYTQAIMSGRAITRDEYYADPDTPPTIRAARPEDAALLAAAEREVAALPKRVATTPAEIDDAALRGMIVDLEDRGRGRYLVAEYADRIVGHAFLEPLPLSATAHVVRLSLFVHVGHEHRAVGRALMEGLLRWARASSSVEKVELQVLSANATAIAMYRAHGFVEEGRKTRRVKIGPKDYLDDVYMALWVSDSSGAK